MTSERIQLYPTPCLPQLKSHTLPTSSFSFLSPALYFPKRRHQSFYSEHSLPRTTEYGGCYLEDINWYLITALIPSAAIFNLSHTQTRKLDPEVKPTLRLKNSHRFNRLLNYLALLEAVNHLFPQTSSNISTGGIC